jgi:hypothetical protein
MIPTIQTKIKREAEKKYIKNSYGLFREKEPHSVLMPIIKKTNESNNISEFLIQIKIVVI